MDGRSFHQNSTMSNNKPASKFFLPWIFWNCFANPSWLWASCPKAPWPTKASDQSFHLQISCRGSAGWDLIETLKMWLSGRPIGGSSILQPADQDSAARLSPLPWQRRCPHKYNVLEEKGTQGRNQSSVCDSGKCTTAGQQTPGQTQRAHALCGPTTCCLNTGSLLLVRN